MIFVKKIFFLFVLSAVFFWNILPALAAEELKVEFNPLCWEKKECQDARAQFVGKENTKTNAGWLENEAPCDKIGWGMCLPVNATKAQISFGGSATFSDAGQYIKTVYNYSLVIIGILAVVMIIIAGAQWVTSAGNSEAIGSAKKRITGAVIGLFIAYMSYNILQSINPATINLRLPQIYMIRPQVLASKWCRDMKPEQEFYFAAGWDSQINSVKATGSESTKLKYPFNMAPYNTAYSDAQPDKFLCGNRYFIDGASADQSCWGDKCPAGMTCMDVFPPDSNTPNYCGVTTIYGHIRGLQSGTLEGVAMETWERVDDAELYLVCTEPLPNGKTVEVNIAKSGDFENADQTKEYYTIGATSADLDSAVSVCGDATKVRGAFMLMNFIPNSSLNFIGEQKAIGAGGKEIWGGPGLSSLIENTPGAWKDSALIPFASIQAGTNIDIDVSDMKMWVKLTTSVSQAVGILFGDTTMSDSLKQQMQDLMRTYGRFMLDAVVNKLLNAK